MSTPKSLTSIWRCGAYATASTQTRAVGLRSCTAEAMALMSWMVPRMLLAWVQVTRRVLSESRAARPEARSLGLVLASGTSVLGFHHLRTSFWRSARSTQGAMLASWSTAETISSSPSWKRRAYETLRNSWVVEGPITAASQMDCPVL